MRSAIWIVARDYNIEMQHIQKLLYSSLAYRDYSKSGYWPHKFRITLFQLLGSFIVAIFKVVQRASPTQSSGFNTYHLCNGNSFSTELSDPSPSASTLRES